jgi:tetratricopeptide (TPR) repeat protein
MSLRERRRCSRILARRCEHLTERSRRGEIDLQAQHYYLEAEHHYYRAGDTAKALACVLRVAAALSRTDGATRQWLAGTLHDFASTPALAEALVAFTPSERLEALDTLVEVASNIPGAISLREAMKEAGQWLDLSSRLYLKGRDALVQGDVDRAAALFKRALVTASPKASQLVIGTLSMCIGETVLEKARQTHNHREILKCRRWYERAAAAFRKAHAKEYEALALDNVAAALLTAGDVAKALKTLPHVQRVLSATTSSRGVKGEIYGNISFAYLLNREPEKSEGFFLESAAHYSMEGDFNGLANLYIWLYGCLDRLPRDPTLTRSRLYRTAFYTWGYARPPRTFGQILELNGNYFGWAVKGRKLQEATRALLDLGYLLRDDDPEVRVELARKAVASLTDTFGTQAVCERVLPKLERSRWWREEEVIRLDGGGGTTSQ